MARVHRACGAWSPREESNLHDRVRSPAVCPLAYEAMVPTGRVERPLSPSEGGVLSIERRGEMVTRARLELASAGLKGRDLSR